MVHAPWIWSDSFYVDISGKSSRDLKLRFLQAVNATEGVTVLSSDTHEFEGGGVIVLVSLAESHAALHTWPEHGIGWVGLFTCGDERSLNFFREQVKKWVGPPRDLQKSDALALTLPTPPMSD
jgi:S-adenosylmethionine/arginine decarboxylase-like enzyme